MDSQTYELTWRITENPLLLPRVCPAHGAKPYNKITEDLNMCEENEEIEYISKEELMNHLREALTEMFRAQRTGEKQMTLQQLINEL